MGRFVLRSAVAGGSSSYTATHYVAPYTEVAGATEDDEDMGATAWTNAASSSTPTTAGTAMRRATAGNKTRFGSGVYELTPVFGGGSTTRFTAALHPRNSGTAENPIVWFAENPAATSTGLTELPVCELRRENETFTDDVVCPVIGTAGAPGAGNYHIFDGFYINETLCRAGASSGVCQVVGGPSTGIEWRRMVIDRRDITAYDEWSSAPVGGYNGNSWFVQGATDVRWVDCYILGNNTMTNESNDAVIETYSLIDGVIENCTFIQCGYSWYFKAENEGGQLQDNCIARFNLVDSYNGGSSQICGNTTVYQNVIRATNFPGTWYNPAGVDPAAAPCHWYNNTLICTGGTFQAAMYIRGNRVSDGTDSFYNNIVYVNGSNSVQFVELESQTSGVPMDEFDRYNYNVYYRADGGTPRWVDSGVSYTSFASWQTQAATYGTDPHSDVYESDSIYQDPLFVNYGAGNFRLQGGSPALTAGVGGAPAGAYITGNEEIGVRANPTY